MRTDERAVRGGTLRVARDASDLARRAADVFASIAEDAVRKRGRFMVALAGGDTPRALYAVLAADAQVPAPRLDWSRARVFWGDERCVPPDHPESNYRMASEALLDKVPIPAAHVHRMRGEDEDPQRAADLYASVLRAAFGAPAPELPRFDLVLLGLGADAHTASLFPGSSVLRETARLVAAPHVEKLAAHRLTLTPPVLNAAMHVVFLVSGRAKAGPLRDVLEQEVRPELRPAQCVRPERGELLWLVDAEAASRLGA
jgi:6-phosphogluconolactonase